MKTPLWKKLDNDYEVFPREFPENENENISTNNSAGFTRNLIFICLLIFTALSTGFLFYHYNHIAVPATERIKSFYLQTYETVGWQPTSCNAIRDEQKFDCFPRGTADQKSCFARGCCWSPRSEHDAVPWCYYPKNYQTYKVANITQTSRGIDVLLNNVRKSVYPKDIKSLSMKIMFESKSRLRIKITDTENTRYEPPYPDVPIFSSFSLDTDYEVIMDKDSFGFAVRRKDTGTVLFDTTNIGGFIYSDQFLQISALIPSKHVYGLGEQRNNFLLNTNWNIITLFNGDHPPVDHQNLYGTHPFYLALEDGGISHGVFLLNSNAMDIILQPSPAITYRTIGGVLDFYFFLGPSPNDVVKQYVEIIGYPFMPPYWSLGFHLCRFGLHSLNATVQFWKRNRDAGIPFDVQWNDIDYMSGRNDFTISKNFTGLQNFVEQLHNVGMKYVIIVDPGVAAGLPSGSYPPYDEGVKSDIFIKNSSDLPLMGEVWNSPKVTAFPDFTNPHTISYWLEMLTTFYKKVPYDGLWLDMNEISNFVNGSLQGCSSVNNTLDNPPYVPNVRGGHLNYQTVCMNAKQYAGSHYDVHNIHGFAECIASSFCLATIRMKRPFILSRSTFPGSGHFGAHWTGDVFSTWDDMKHSVADIMSFSLFGIPMVGADICGFNRNTEKQLCQRWQQLGAFYPFSRNHNSDDCIDQDPAVWGQDFIDSTKKALNIRYRFLPYFYTLFYYAHLTGDTVIRPLFFEFPEDNYTYDQHTQFLWGPAMLIVPVLTENATSVTSYFPKSWWFDLYTLELHRSNGDYVTVTAPLDKIPIYIRAGYIIPFQEPAQTTTESRKNPFGLYVTLDENGRASGSLYWDDGDSYLAYDESLYNLLDFECSGSEIFIWPSHWGYNVTMKLNTVYVGGVSGEVKKIYVNEEEHKQFTSSPASQKLVIQSINIDLSGTSNITWV